MFQAPADVQALVARYERERHTLQSGAYGEADTRKEFVEPLFAALGWDVYNTSGYAEAYKDVVNEYSLKIGETLKAPDYAFRIGGARKFFVEAKRPSIDLTKDGGPAYQLRRYGWTAKLPVSVLVNFRHIAVYDCTVRPEDSDKPSVSRTLLVPWTELEERWAELASLVGKIAVYQGSLDRYAVAAARRRGTSLVDDEFLLQMEVWRANLAKNFALRNPALTVGELNEAVQQTIDRLVFLRIAEDRGIEPYGTLKDQVKRTGGYSRLFDTFRTADARYNSGLFHFKKDKTVSGAPDLLTPALQLDDSVIRNVVNSMYYPTSPYEFSVLPADILGQVYEQFLGKVIRLDANHRAVIEDKPEVKKAGGVFYTPTHVVDYIVARTLGVELQGKTPKAALNLRVLDPACGSGSFLLGAYDYLLKWFEVAYAAGSSATRSRVMYRDHAGEWRLTLAERKRILKSCIYGVDIDRQAVEVTKLSLMLKLLEGESSETLNSQMQMFHVERVLPDLNINIQCGNSLVDFDVTQHLTLTAEEEDALNPFDWRSAFPEAFKGGGFHAVIGNPPYDVLEKDRGASSWPHGTLREYLPFRPDFAPALGGKLNLYRLFLVQATQLVRHGGRFGMIVPLSLAADISTAGTRGHVLSHLRDPLLDCFPQKDNPARRIFKRAKLSTMVLTGTVSTKGLASSNVVTTRLFPGNDLSEAATENRLTLADSALVDPETLPIPLTDVAEWALCRRLHALPHVRRLGQCSDSYAVARGEVNQTIYRKYITSNPDHARLIKGVEIGAFEIHQTLSQGAQEWLDEDRFFADFPRRNSPPPTRLATQRITGVDERQRVVAAVVGQRAWFADSTNSIAVVATARLSLEYLAALLNSDLLQWRFRITSTNNNVGTNELLALPIRILDDDSLTDQATYDKLCLLSRRLTQVKTEIAHGRSSATVDALVRRRDATMQQLNDLVFEWYGLTTAERTLVETRLLRRPAALASTDDAA